MNKIANITHKIFYDNKFLTIFSFVLAVIIWLVVAISLSPIDTAVIKNVPVTLDLTNSVPAQFDLQIFGQSEFTVDVEVSGKRYIINSASVNENSLKVIAQTAYVDSAGKHTLALKVTKTDENDEFEIVSVSEQYIEVYFDVYKELDFPIAAKVLSDGDIVKDGYISGEPLLSVDTVTVSGPATEIDSISEIFAEITVDRALEATKTQEADIKAYNENGGTLHYLTFNYGNSEITVTLPVYYVVEASAAVDFKNTPLAYIENPFSYTVSPSVIEVGLQGVNEDNVPGTVSITSVDFTQLNPGMNTIVITADSVSSVYFTDGTEELTVKVDVTGCTQKTLTVPDENINFINSPDGYEVGSIQKSVGSVRVVGPQSSLDGISASDIYAVVDLTNVDVAAEAQTFTAKLSVKNSTDCWVSGEYTVTVR